MSRFKQLRERLVGYAGKLLEQGKFEERKDKFADLDGKVVRIKGKDKKGLVEVVERDGLGVERTYHVRPERLQGHRSIEYREATIPTPEGYEQAVKMGLPVPTRGSADKTLRDTRSALEMMRSVPGYYEHFDPTGATKKGQTLPFVRGEYTDDQTLFVPLHKERGVIATLSATEQPKAWPDPNSSAVRGAVARALPYVNYIRQELADQDGLRSGDDEGKLAVSATVMAQLSTNAPFKQNLMAHKAILDLMGTDYNGFIRDVIDGKYNPTGDTTATKDRYNADSVKVVEPLYEAIYTPGVGMGYPNLARNVKTIRQAIQRHPHLWEDPRALAGALRSDNREFLVEHFPGLGYKTGSFATHLFNQHAPVITVDRHQMALLDMGWGGVGYSMQPSPKMYKDHERWFLDTLEDYKAEGIWPKDSSPFLWQYALWLASQNVDAPVHHQQIFDAVRTLK